MNSKQWEKPTGWPETKAQRDELKNALLERMLAWDGRQAELSYYEWKKATKPPRERAVPKPIHTLHSSYLSAELPKGQLHSVVAAMPANQLRKLIERDGLKCCWCGRVCNPTLRANAGAYPTREHIIRLADGGTSAMVNLKVACRKCNNSRHAKDWKPI